jgi:hypothetical protein
LIHHTSTVRVKKDWKLVGFKARCTCNWQSKVHVSLGKALGEGQAHLKEVMQT